MAATYRTSAAGGSSSGTGNRTAVITPAVGDLLVVYCFVAANTNDTPTCSDNNGSGTYDRIDVMNASISSINYRLSVFIRTALMANTTSTTITANTGSNTSGVVHAVAVSGMSRVGADAVRSKGSQNNQAAGTAAPALNQNALTGNLTIAVCGSADTTTTQPTNWTERQDTSQSNDTVALATATRDSGFTGTTITFGAAQSTVFCSHALELDGSTLFTRTAAIDGAGSVDSAAIFFSVFIGAVVLDATGLVVSAGQRALQRSSAVNSLAGIAISAQFFSVFTAGVAIDASGSIESAGSFVHVIQRSVSLDVGATISAIGNLDLLRSAGVDADVEVNSHWGDFPITRILDDFNRADEGPPLSAEWNGIIRDGGTEMSVQANRARSVSGLGSQAWNTILGPDCEAFCTIALAPALGSADFGIYLRAVNLGSGLDCYVVEGGLSQLRVVRFDDGAPTTIQTLDIGSEPISGECVGASITENIISVYLKRIGSPWELVGTVDDSTYTASGAVGIHARNTTRLDNFGAGRINIAVVESSTSFSVAVAIESLGQRESLRSAAADANAEVSVSGSFFSILSGSSLIDGAALIESAGVIQAGSQTWERAALVNTTSAIFAASQRDIIRNSSFGVTASVESSGASLRVFERAIETGAIATINSSALRELLRASALNVTSGLDSSALFFSVTESTGAFEGNGVVSASGQIGGSIHEKSVSFVTNASIITSSIVLRGLFPRESLEVGGEVRLLTIGSERRVVSVASRVQSR